MNAVSRRTVSRSRSTARRRHSGRSPDAASASDDLDVGGVAIESLPPLVRAADDAGFARHDVGTGGVDRAPVGRIDDRSRREPRGDGVAREVVVGELEHAAEHATGGGVGEPERSRAVPRDAGGVEHLRYETTVRLRDACDDRDAMERQAALGVLDDAAGDRARPRPPGRGPTAPRCRPAPPRARTRRGRSGGRRARPRRARATGGRRGGARSHRRPGRRR